MTQSIRFDKFQNALTSTKYNHRKHLPFCKSERVILDVFLSLICSISCASTGFLFHNFLFVLIDRWREPGSVLKDTLKMKVKKKNICDHMLCGKNQYNILGNFRFIFCMIRWIRNMSHFVSLVLVIERNKQIVDISKKSLPPICSFLSQNVFDLVKFLDLSV